MQQLWQETENKERFVRGRDLVDVVFSWSLRHVLNPNLYKGRVDKIPNTFPSTTEYFKSFVNPIIEETHAALRSSMEALRRSPSFKISMIKPAKDFKPPRSLFYKVSLQSMSDNMTNDGGETFFWFNDLIAVTDKKPSRIDDLRFSNESHLLALVCGVDPDSPHLITILASKPIVFEEDYVDVKLRGKTNTVRVAKDPSLVGVYLVNMMTNIRIWEALHPGPEGGNLELISRVLESNNNNNEDDDNGCIQCQENSESVHSEPKLHSFKLNSPQEDAISRCLETRNCYHSYTLKLIWGPPGTGKTKTTSVLLFNLLKMKCRTLTCTPTNIAVLEVTSRLLKLLSDSLGVDGYGLGDVVLFGSKERMKIDDRGDLYDVFLDYRVDELYNCFMAETGWRANANLMICLLSDPKEAYRLYLVKKERDEKDKLLKTYPLSFKEFVQKSFGELRNELQYQFPTLCLHLPTASLSFRVAEKMNQTNDLLRYITVSDVLVNPNSCNGRLKYVQNDTRKQDCVKMLKSICERIELPDSLGKSELKKFCLGNAYLLFCTASCSARLHMSSPIRLLVIDEAAQLKECESAIPLQLPGVQHAILIGDEKQLPAMIESKIASEADLGRSLFERLVLLGHRKQLLNMQYRMHPSINIFPNREFYDMKILDAPSVRMRSYERKFLPEKMYGPYSFINVAYGREQFGDGYSLKNVVEVSVVAEIVSKLYSVSRIARKPISVGVISPYKAQVFAIQEKIGEKYNNSGGKFSLSIRSVDGFQGGEEDIIIISTVRSNGNGAIGFLSNQQRTNVALTRARYCLWILGNDATLTKNKSVWRQLVDDAKKRNCFHDAEDDDSLAQCIDRATTAIDDLDKLRNNKLISFENSIWKVWLSDEFFKSLETIVDSEINRRIMSFLEELSNGELQQELESESESLLRQHDFDDGLSLIWAVDIIKKENHNVQVLKIWHVLQSSFVSGALERLEKRYQRYTKVKMEQCTCICSQGNLVVPMRWPVNSCSKSEVISNVSRSFALLSLVDEETDETSNPIMKQCKLRKVWKIRRKVSTSIPNSQNPK